MNKLTGYCGISCENCPTFIATKTDDDILKINTSIEWSRLFNKTIVPSVINCTGCKSESNLFEHCHSCKIRTEGNQKNIQENSALLK